MMLLDTESVIKRAAVAVASVLIVAGFAATYYYVQNFDVAIADNKSEATSIKQALQGETDSIRTTINAANRELKSSISVTAEESKKLDSELRNQSQTVKQLLQDLDRYKAEVKNDFAKLRTVNEALLDQLKAKDQWYSEQIKLRDATMEKYRADARADVTNLQELLKIKDREMADLRLKLDREIEWRTKNFWYR